MYIVVHAGFTLNKITSPRQNYFEYIINYYIIISLVYAS